MKICTKCKQEKPLSSFGKRSSSKDGLFHRCKVCRAEDSKIYRENNREKVRERGRKYDRAHPDRVQKKNKRYHKENREKILERKKEWYSTEHGKEVSRANHKKWASENKWKISAHTAVENAIKRGDLIKPLCCQECGKEAILQGHHEDYNDKLNVIWLCKRCHQKADDARRESGKEKEQLKIWAENKAFKNSEEEIERKKQEQLEHRQKHDREKYYENRPIILERRRKSEQKKMKNDEYREKKRKISLEYYHKNSERLNEMARERYAMKNNKE